MSTKPATVIAVGVALILVGLAIVLLWPEDPSLQVRTEWLADPPSGPVRLCGGEDVSGSRARAVRDYNRKFSSSEATFVASAFNADAQHDEYVESIQSGSYQCDVILLDVIYMAEFAAGGLLYDMTPYLQRNDLKARFDSRMMETAQYDGTLWGVPKQLDVGALYYRADRVPKPSSWRQVYEQARPRGRRGGGLRLPLGPYEGLTVGFLELAYSAGADPIISKDGRTANIDQSRAREALTFVRDLIRDGAIPNRQQTDLGNLDVYERGRAAFLRGWPFVAAQIRDDADKGLTARTRSLRRATAVRTKIVALPPWRPGRESIGVLGGHNLVIPRSAQHESAALHLIDYMTSKEQVRKDMEEDSQFPVLDALAKEFGAGYRELLDALKATTVIARPSIRHYATVSTIISCGVKEILFDSPGVSIRAKLQEINGDVQAVLDGGPPSVQSCEN